jgi:hypothetical protein
MNEATLKTRLRAILERAIDRGGGAANEARNGLLSAIWSFLRHPTVLEDRVIEFEERLAAVERRIVGDLKATIESRFVAAEGGVAAVEHRLEEDLKHAIRSRVAAVEGRLQTVRGRVVGELKAELRRAIRILVLGTGAGVLALVGALYALMGAWLSLKALLGAISASFTLAVAFLILSAVALTILSTVRRRSGSPAPSV